MSPGFCADTLAIEEVRLKQEEERTKQEVIKRETMLIKQKARARPAGSTGTSTIPSRQEPAVPALSPSSTDAVAPVTVSSTQRSAKDYAELFRSVVSASGWDISFHNKSTQVKLLSRDHVATLICEYTAVNMKNAYCALILDCESDPSVYLAKHLADQLPQHYCDNGVKTPPNPLLP